MNLLPPVIPPRARSRPGSTSTAARRTESQPRSSIPEIHTGERNGSTGTIESIEGGVGEGSRRASDEPVGVKDQVDQAGVATSGKEVVSGSMANGSVSMPTSSLPPDQVELPSSSAMNQPRKKTTNPEIDVVGVKDRAFPSGQLGQEKQEDQPQTLSSTPSSSGVIGLNISGTTLSSSSSSSSASPPSSTLIPNTTSSHPFPQTYTVIPDSRLTTQTSSSNSVPSGSRRKPSADMVIIPTRTTSRTLFEGTGGSTSASLNDNPSTSSNSNTRSQTNPSKSGFPAAPPLISPFSSPSMPDVFDPTYDPHLLPSSQINPNPRARLANRESLRGEERRSSEMEDLSSSTTGTGTGTNTTTFSTPMVTPPERDLNWSAQAGKFNHALGPGQTKPGNLLPPPQAQGLSSSSSQKPRTGSGSSSVNNFFKRPSPVQTSSTGSFHSFASSSQQGTRPGSVVPPAAAGYVNARMAREEERRVELEQKSKKESKKEAGNAVAWVGRDGYKIVDGVEKKRSTSGVYTPATFPGATGKQRSASATSSLGMPSPGTPETPYTFETPTPPPIPDSSTSTYFPRQFSGTSPARAGYSPGEQEAAISKKRSIIGGLKSPSFTGMKSAMTDGWRRSSADAVPNPPRLDAAAPTLRTRLGSANDAYDQPDNRHSLASNRLRSVSDQPFRPLPPGRAATALDGLGLALADRSAVDSGYPVKVPMELLEVPDSARPSLDVSDMPPPLSTTSSLQGRPRNVKGLTLPLSNLHGTAETEAVDRSPSLAAVEAFSPGNPVLGVVAKGVRRKPVPQS